MQNVSLRPPACNERVLGYNECVLKRLLMQFSFTNVVTPPIPLAICID